MTYDLLKPHRRWLAILGAALLLLFAVPPLAHDGLEHEERRAAAIAADRAALEDAAARFRDDMLLAEKLDGQMSAGDIDRLLAPVDRLRVATGLERQASSSRFAHFTYTLAPEKKARADALDADNMTESELTMAADMPLDTDAYAFLDHIGYLLPGRVRLRQLSVTRPAADGALSLANIHMEATVEWLSNGTAEHEKAGGS